MISFLAGLSGFFIGLANVLMILTSLFLICLILIQRGKGGGLAGAFGGVGGSSAFGTKAGDVFTKVTIYVAIFWFALAICLVWASNSKPKSAFSGISADSALDDIPVRPGDKAKDRDADTTVPGDTIDVPPAKPTVPPNPGKAGIEETTNKPPADPIKKP